MITRLLVNGRQVVAAAVASGSFKESSAIALGSHLSAATSALLRDGGCEASTSYSASEQRRAHATAAAATEPTIANTYTSAPSPTSASSTTATTAHPPSLQDDPLSGLDMPALMRAILHPLPLGRVRNPALFSGAAAPYVHLNRDTLFFDPSATLSSTMRALYVIRSVLRTDGHVLVVNCNPTMRPLLREAAHLCINSNVWFWYDDWQPGLLTGAPDAKGRPVILTRSRCQPSRRLITAQRGSLQLRNPLASPASMGPGRFASDSAGTVNASTLKELMDVVQGTARSVNGGGWAVRQKRREHRAALEALMAARIAQARLLPLGSAPSAARRTGKKGVHPDLVVLMDLSYGTDVAREAYDANVPVVSLLNGHSDSKHVTYPVYASEAHAGYQHFLLEWLLRLVNLPAPAQQAL